MHMCVHTGKECMWAASTCICADGLAYTHTHTHTHTHVYTYIYISVFASVHTKNKKTCSRSSSPTPISAGSFCRECVCGRLCVGVSVCAGACVLVCLCWKMGDAVFCSVSGTHGICSVLQCFRNTSVSGTPVFHEHQCFRNTSASGTPVFLKQCRTNLLQWLRRGLLFCTCMSSLTMGKNREVSMHEIKYVSTSR